MKWIPAYVGVGSNLQDPPRQVRAALAALAELPATQLVCQSRLYGSRPLGPVAQADFCNAAAGLLTQLDAHALLAALRTLEHKLGREPTRERWGPRVIDLDLLVYGSERRTGASLTLPHPGMAERSFVLRPLCDFAPDLLVPGLGRVADLAARLPGDDLWLIDAGKIGAGSTG
jgi:2-amino-4-hydroxy-6-hydroxymethyldihydropteridine diphosphokinase